MNTILTSPCGEEFPQYRLFTLNKFKGFNFIGFPPYQPPQRFSHRRRNVWGWGLHSNRLVDVGPFNTFNLRRLVYKQLLRNSNLGAFLTFWKGQKRNISVSSYSFKIINKTLSKIKILGAINERIKGDVFLRYCSPMGDEYLKGKRLVCSLLGFRSWSRSFNFTTIY